MIGVAAAQQDLELAEEFFQLFKTPWEPVVSTRKYSVVLTTGPCSEEFEADLILAYGSGRQPVDRDTAARVEPVDGPTIVEWEGHRFPIYGRIGIFRIDAAGATLRANGRALDYSSPRGTRGVRRVGYDLFDEVRYLLTIGQPAEHALTPTLELHIALLRRLLSESGVGFVEIPPRPAGHEFVCCLTHDVDFFGIRRHKFDKTLAGFVVRASVGTVVALVRRTRTFPEAVRNWSALLSLPLVFLHLKRDFWHPFDDYARAEAGRPSTFFLMPFKGRPGIGPKGTVDQNRAVNYQISDITAEAKQALAQGVELGVHGIDAWNDAQAGRAELAELTSVTAGSTAGIRMHWLYTAPDSAKQIEAAGFAYDSTWGYNDAIGYRAGTSQVFHLPGTRDLMELPMSIMDTALFYRDRMGLAREAASALCRRIVANAWRFGGTVVVNWHCRSLAPERQWGRFYRGLLGAIGERAWYATATEAVSWFRWRRSIRFDTDSSGAITIAAPRATPGPVAIVQIHRAAVHKDPVENKYFDGRQPVRCVI